MWIRGLTDSIIGKVAYVDDVFTDVYLTLLINRYEAYAGDVTSKKKAEVITLTKRAELMLVKLSELNRKQETEIFDKYDIIHHESLFLAKCQSRVYPLGSSE